VDGGHGILRIAEPLQNLGNKLKGKTTPSIPWGELTEVIET
jgi:hypothetical protein